MGEFVSAGVGVRRRPIVLRSLLSRAVVGGLALASLLAVLVVGALVAVRSHENATRWAEHSAHVLEAVQLAEREVVDLETGVRGYAATDDRLFLGPWYAGLSALPPQLTELHSLVSDNPAQTRRMVSLADSIDSYITTFMKPFVARRRLMHGAALLAFMIEGKHLLDGIRARFAVFDSVERRLQATRDRGSARADRVFVELSLAAGALMVLGLLSFVWFVIRRVVLPLRRTIEACERTIDGRPGASLAIGGASELVALGTAFDRVLEQLHEREDERRTASEAIAEMLCLHETVIDSAQHAHVSFDEHGIITSWNPAAARIFDRSRERAVGEPILACVAEGAREVWSEEIRRYHATGESRLLGRLVESTGRRADGTEFPAELTVTVAAHRGHPTFHAFIADISDRIERQRDLRLMASIVEGSEDAIFTESADGRVISWNHGAEILYGYRAEEIMGRPLTVLVPPGRQGEEHQLLERALTGKAITRLETERVRRDGRHVHVALTVSPLYRGDDTIVGASIIARDVTEHRQMEDDLRSSREQALEASRLKSEFVANMSHEIRTPLNGVVSMAELLLETQLGTDQREYAQVALTSAEALMRVINEILDFSKIEAGKLDIVSEDFSLRAAVEEVAEITGVKASERGLKLEVEIEDDIADVVRGDGNRVRQVLMNLLSNAIKFTAAGQVTVRVSLQDHPVGSPVLRIEVQDTGIGINPARVSALFEPFSQEDATTTRRYGGTGLGLCISKQLVDLMGGEIGCDSIPGKGSCFSFTLPYHPSDGMEVLAESTDLTGSKMLIVEAATTDRLPLESRLTSWGVSPDRAGDAAAALRLLRRGADEGRPYQAALLVGSRGGRSELDGLALAREIRSIPALRCTRLILVSDTPVDPAQARAAGIDAQLIKPVRQSRLYNQLLSTVRRARDGAIPPSRPVEGLPASTQGGPAGHPGPIHVLVAEDNEVNQFAASRLLQTFGFSVDVARNGREAITMTGRRDYAAVFMDCQMPEMDGFSAAEAIRLREQDTGGRIPIVALTANALEGDRDRCLSAGMDDYLAKPLRLQTIESLIERIPALQVGPDSPGGAGAAAGSCPSTPMFDPSALVDLGDPTVAAALAEMFLEQAKAGVPALSAAIRAPDPILLAQLAHGLQGSAATVGAQRMSELAEQLCEIAAAGAMEQHAVALVAELTAALQDTSAAVGEHLRTVNS